MSSPQGTGHPKEDDLKRYITTTEAAEKLGISRVWLWLLTKQDRVTAHASIGSTLGWDPERLDEVRAAIPVPYVHVSRQQ